MAKKIALIDLLTASGQDPQEARRAIQEGRVSVEGRVETSPNRPVPAGSHFTIRPEKSYVSRAAYKLLGALELFHPRIEGRVCLDLGASHGGFTQVLLERGARRVYALDVAYGILDYSIRRDERVVPLERTNARHLNRELFQPEDLKDPSGLFITSDLSFISIKTILRSIRAFAEENALPVEGILLVKPQFEDSAATEKGIIQDPDLRFRILEGVLSLARSLGYEIVGAGEASLQGTHGNQEYTVYLKWREGGAPRDAGRDDTPGPGLRKDSLDD